MKRIPLLALCALFALNAGARTLYVDAKRPNNNGNGLSAATAKKTIQAAINVSKRGDIILVFPGTYAPIKTNNKKISIKTVKGKSKTKMIVRTQCIALDLSKKGRRTYYREWIKGGGTSTSISGFRCSPVNWGTRTNPNYQMAAIAVGGTVKNCSFEHFIPVDDGTFEGYSSSRQMYVYYKTSEWDWINFASGTNFRNCSFSGLCDNSDYWSNNHFTKCSFSRCSFRNNGRIDFYLSKLTSCSISYKPKQEVRSESTRFSRCKFSSTGKASSGLARIEDSTFTNCLFDKAASFYFYRSTLFNCTICKTAGFSGENCLFSNTILWNNKSHVRQVYIERWMTVGGETIHDYKTVGSGNSFSNTFTDNRNPKFVNAAKGNYKLKKGSPCINLGKLTKAQKKLVGTKDLAGNKRIKGKAIDLGCYEY